MRSTIAFLLCVASLGLGGCARQLNPEPVVPTTVTVDPPIPVAPLVVTRTDLPVNWFEVKQDNWSYGLPIGFDRVPIVIDRITSGLSNVTLVQHNSVSKGISINFSTHTTFMDLKAYVASFVSNVNANKGLVLDTAQSVNAEQPIIAVHSLHNITGVVAGVTPVQASLDFFLQKDDTVYQMSCFGEGMKLKVESETCFEVVSTVLIK